MWLRTCPRVHATISRKSFACTCDLCFACTCDLCFACTCDPPTDQNWHNRHMRHQSQPSAISATPATQNERVDVSKRHAGHAKVKVGVAKCHAATQMPRPCPQAPRLPGKCYVHVAKCHHACHAKCRGAPGDQRGPSAPPEPTQRDKCHACHAKRGLMWANATPAMPKTRWVTPSATPAMQKLRPCRQVPRLPRLPRKWTVYVAGYHACHAKCRGAPGDQQGPSATRASPAR